jgi:hypothetical protein
MANSLFAKAPDLDFLEITDKNSRDIASAFIKKQINLK